MTRAHWNWYHPNFGWHLHTGWQTACICHGTTAKIKNIPKGNCILQTIRYMPANTGTGLTTGFVLPAERTENFAGKDYCNGMTELEEYIHTYFGLQQENLEKMAGFFREESLSKGKYFLKAGHYAEKLSFVRSGLIRVYVATEDKEVTQWISSPGYFITELSGWLFHTPSRWNMQALTDCTLYSINREDYRQLGTVVDQWHEIEKLFIAKCFTIIEDRVFGLLSMSAEERYKVLFEKHRELFRDVPQQYLASMIGMTPETFSRIRRKLA